MPADPRRGTSRPPGQAREQQPHSVTELTLKVKFLLETTFPEVWVEGEISNFTRSHAGHCYLTLKDDESQMRVVIWRNAAAAVPFKLEDGMMVVCRGYLDVYAARGTYQLVVESIQPRGIGALELALRQLREKLAAEGLFDLDRKRPLPRFPRRVAVVTSPTGAAIRDFLQVARRRWQGVHILIAPTRVQGEGAGAEVAASIERVNQLADPPDCLVVTRGGGSLEDLWAFNEEVVVRAIAASRIPVVSGVGHEIDVTLADLAADVRALTPSEAAERVVPDAHELRAGLAQFQRRLSASLRSRAEGAKGRLAALAASRVLRRPLERVHESSRQLDQLHARATRVMEQRLVWEKDRTAGLAGRLESLSPLAVLSRGYSLTQRESDDSLVVDAGQLSQGEVLVTRVAKGRFSSRVEEIVDE